MSGEMAVRAAVIAGLRGDVALMDLVNGAYEGAPVRAAMPYVAVGEGVAVEWGAKGVEGVEVRLVVNLHDAGPAPAALGPVMARVGVVMAALGDAGGGWRVVGARLVRSRVARAGKGVEGWNAAVEWRVRAVLEA